MVHWGSCILLLLLLLLDERIGLLERWQGMLRVYGYKLRRRLLPDTHHSELGPVW